jgi:ferredoxin
VGSPVYYYRLPFNVADYVKGLPDMAGMPAFAFVLHGTYRGDGGNDLCRGLVQKGARLVGYFHSHGAGTFYGYFKHGYQFSPGHPSSEELAEAEAFGQEAAERAASQAAVVLSDEPSLAAIYRLERFSVGQWLTRNLHSRLFRVDKAKCSGCGHCVRECPVGNITPDADKHPVWGRECILCLYCEMNCPEEAISSSVTTPIFLPFIKYNVRAASHDSKLDHRRATVDHGRLKNLP